MGFITDLYDELAEEHGNPKELLGTKFPLRRCSEEIRKLIFENDDFQNLMSDKNIDSKNFENIDDAEYRGFLNKMLPNNNQNVKNWLGLNPSYNAISLSRENAIRILFTLEVSNIKRANQFILKACGDDAYALYARDYRDLIYKFCLQRGFSFETAEELISEHKCIEMSSFELLRDILLDLSVPDVEIDKVIWESFYDDGYIKNKKGEIIKDQKGENKKKIDGAKRCIESFYKINNNKADVAIRDKAISQYAKDLSDEDSYILLLYVFKEVLSVDKPQAIQFVKTILWEDFYQNEVKSVKNVIHGFCKRNSNSKNFEDVAVVKYMNNYKLFKDTIHELGEENGFFSEAKAFVAAVDWENFYENERKNSIAKIRDFCQMYGLSSDIASSFIKKYGVRLDNKNKGTHLFNKESGDIVDIPCLRRYLEQNKHIFGTYRRTAYEKFRFYWQRIVNPSEIIGEKEDFETFSFDDVYGHLVQVGEALSEEDHVDLLPNRRDWEQRIKDSKARDMLLSSVQKIIKDNAVIDDSTLKDIKNKKSQVMRKYLIWVFMYTWGSPIHDFEKPTYALNKELEACGYPTLDSRNPFDFIVMNTMFYESRLEFLKQEDSLTNEQKKELEEDAFSALEQIKKVLKEFYDI